MLEVKPMRKAFFACLGFWFMAVMVVGLALRIARVPFPNVLGGHVLFVAAGVTVIAWILYVWDVFHNNRLPKEKRSLWAVILIFLGPYAMPFYFWFYVR